MLPRSNYRKTFFYFLLASSIVSLAHAAPSLTARKVSGPAGSTINLPIAFADGGSPVSAVQFSLTLPPSVSPGTLTPGDMLTKAGKSISSNQNGNKWTIIVFGLNQNLMGQGTLLTAQLKIASGAPVGTLNVPLTGVTFSDLNGNVIAPAKGQKTSLKVTISQ